VTGLERATTSDPDWATAPVPTEAPAGRPLGAYTPGKGRVAWRRLVGHLAAVQARVEAMGRAVPHATQDRLETLNAGDLAGAVAVVQDLRRDLAELEASLVRAIGRDEAAPKVGTLPDGRTYEIVKGKDRKGWDHETWQRDVRRQVLSGLTDVTVVAVESGETVDVAALLAAVQAVHGAGAPKTTSLKALGLAPDDYCESFPGPWGAKITKGSD